MIPLYSKMSPTDPSLEYTLPQTPSTPLRQKQTTSTSPLPLIIFSETKAVDLTNRFRKDADAYYVEAKRSTVATMAQIPYWVYGVLVVLGWNEAMLVLFNPLYFTMLLVGLVSAWFIIQLGLVGPLFQISRTVGNEVQRQLSNRLREHFSHPALAEPVRTRPLSDQSENDEIKREVRVKREQF
ncbi:Dynamin-like GTPase that mediates homotypic ER fusion [Cerrena zonata]|uniref:Dynamin-like GTPase that mediates homotypic ER fusion n=1 Tax=Cerrena zonata TaxID=2478898 RepID=A0AAW0GRB9_9APHY